MNVYKKIYNNWQDYSNKTVEWFSTDTQDNYKTNLQSNHKQLEQFNWIDNKFTYKFNSQGFRCDEFKQDSIIFLGCSITQGIGMPLGDIFPTIVSNQLNLHCVNLGIERSSANTAFRLASHFLKDLRPKLVIATLLYPHRYELLTSEKAIHFIPNHKFQNKDTYSGVYYSDFYDSWIIQRENMFLNYSKNILAINQLCDQYNIKFIDFTSLIDKNQMIPMIHDPSSLARDLVHPGLEIHRKISEILINNI